MMRNCITGIHRAVQPHGIFRKDGPDLKDVKVYKLTDLGKTEEKTVEVKNGQVTLEAEAETPYVVCKGEEGNINVTWSEGMHITDAGFNGGVESLEANWTKAGDGNSRDR